MAPTLAVACGCRSIPLGSPPRLPPRSTTQTAASSQHSSSPRARPRLASMSAGQSAGAVSGAAPEEPPPPSKIAASAFLSRFSGWSTASRGRCGTQGLQTSPAAPLSSSAPARSSETRTKSVRGGHRGVRYQPSNPKTHNATCFWTAASAATSLASCAPTLRPTWCRASSSLATPTCSFRGWCSLQRARSQRAKSSSATSRPQTCSSLPASDRAQTEPRQPFARNVVKRVEPEAKQRLNAVNALRQNRKQALHTDKTTPNLYCAPFASRESKGEKERQHALDANSCCEVRMSRVRISSV